MKKVFVSLLLSVTMLCSVFSTTAAVGQEEADILSYDERAVVIVTLEKPALLDIYRQNPAGASDLGQFLISERGKQAAADIRSQQDLLRNQLQAQYPDADFADTRSYSAITNAFTVNMRVSDVASLQKMSGVRSAVLSSVVNNIKTQEKDDGEISSEESHLTEISAPAAESPEETSKEQRNENSEETSEEQQEKNSEETSEEQQEKNSEETSEEQQEEISDETSEEPEKKEYDTYGMASKSSIKVRAAYEEGYTGKGMLIAVIDNEFNVWHDVFSIPPEGGRYNEEGIRQLGEFVGFGIAPQYTMEDIFYNGKIVYAYDYGENDNVCRDKERIHGTHVAGIAAGNNGGRGQYDFKGTAYDAQLAFFKISDTNGRLLDEAIVAALDDAVKLSPDVINCSYGAIEYLTHDYEGKQLYEKLMQSGIAVIAAAGNDEYNGYAMGVEKVPLSYVNYNTICSPSSMEGAFSVAASVPDAVYTNHYAMVFNGSNRVPTTMLYSDLSFEEVYGETASVRGAFSEEGTDDVEIDKVGYVYLNGIGQLSDFKGKKVAGKIAIVNESTLPIEKIIKNSIQYQCYAVVIIKKEQHSRLNRKHDIADFFVYTIDSSQKDYFEKHPNGRVSIRTTQNMVEEPQQHAGTITEYSSFGTTSDLSLKPDITAPGDSIFSSIEKRGFGEMSGTSMASPCAAGAYAIVKQYILENGYADGCSPVFTEERIYQMLMSTADILSYKDTEQPLYYTPRLQGAGCINLDNALHTKAFLTVDEARPKVSLKDNEEGKYRFHFTVNNFSADTLTYTPDIILQTDGCQLDEDSEENVRYIHSFVPDDILSRAKTAFLIDGEPVESITVQPHDTVTAEVTLKLNADYVKSHSKLFTNGFFVDGFVRLHSDSEVDLHLPFTGFCGDWSKGAIFPYNIYYDNEFPMGQSTLSIASSFNPDSFFYETAGINIFGYEDLPSNISFGKNSLQSYLHIPTTIYADPCILLPNIYILRDAMDYTISIYNQENILLFCQNFGDISSYFSPSNGPSAYFTEKSKNFILRQYAEFTDTLREGNYTYLLSAATVGTDGNAQRREHIAFHINVDNTVPVIENYYLQKTANGKLYLNVEARDNNYLQGIRLNAVQYDEKQKVAAQFDLMNDMVQYWGSSGSFTSYHYNAETQKYYFRYDLTDYPKFIQSKIDEKNEIYQDGDVVIIFEKETDYSNVQKNHILLEAVDCAYNCSESKIIDIDSYGEAELYFVDDQGKALSGLSLTNNGRTYVSDAQGRVKLKNLPLGNNKLSVLFDYLTAEGGTAVRFRLTTKNYQYHDIVRLKERPQEEPSVELSKSSKKHEESTIIINFGTGDRSIVPFLAAAAVAWISSLSISAVIYRRRRHKR